MTGLAVKKCWRGKEVGITSKHLTLVSRELVHFKGFNSPDKKVRSRKEKLRSKNGTGVQLSLFLPTTPPGACKRLRPTPCPAPQPIRADHARCAPRKRGWGGKAGAGSGGAHGPRRG